MAYVWTISSLEECIVVLCLTLYNGLRRKMLVQKSLTNGHYSKSLVLSYTIMMNLSLVCQ